MEQTNSSIDSSAKEFEQIWPDGYAELFNGRQEIEYEVVRSSLMRFYNPNQVVLEIGCGRGLWTLKYLCPHFYMVFALDVITRPGNLFAPNLEYFQVPDRNFECWNIQSSSIDFVWSYGCFCHLSGAAQAAYFRSIARVLRPGGAAVVMTAKYPEREDKSGANIREDQGPVIWWYNDETLTKQYIRDAGLVDYKDLLPNNHDFMAYSRKPVAYGS